MIFHQYKPTKHETDELNMKLNQFHKSAFGQSFCFIGRIRVWTAPYHTLMILKYFYKNGMVVYCAVKISYMQFTDKIVFHLLLYSSVISQRSRGGGTKQLQLQKKRSGRKFSKENKNLTSEIVIFVSRDCVNFGCIFFPPHGRI